MTNDGPRLELSKWLADPLPSDVSASLRRLTQSDDVAHVAVMPDVHLAGDVCNGTVVATREIVYPLAVGADIGCGMLAVRVDVPADVLRDQSAAANLLNALYETIPSNKHSRSDLPDRLPSHLADLPLSTGPLEKLKHRDGLFQLGTLGRGNHFVEFQSDAEGRLWLMLHSGSRGMGQAITDEHLRSTEKSSSGLGYLEVSSAEGQAYLADLNWAIEYARENRLTMARAVHSSIAVLFAASIDWSTLIHCHHNHVRREVHYGEEFWIHRKGALRAADGEPGVIPGSMGSYSYHVTGRGVEAALRSSSHGAGRRFARHRARQTISLRDLKRQMRAVWFDERHGEELRDEAPHAYKDIGRVMRAQRDLTKIERTLQPILVYKGFAK